MSMSMSMSMSGVVSSNLCLHSKPLGRMTFTRMPPPSFSSHPSPPPPLSFSSNLPMLPILLFTKTPLRSKLPPKIVGFTSNDIKVGSSIEVDGAPWRVLEFLHVKPGKGAAFVRTKIRNFITGNTVDKTFRAGTTLLQADVAKETKQFTYKEGSQYVFMDLSSYEESRLNEDDVGDKKKWLKEGMDCILLFWKGRVLPILHIQSMHGHFKLYYHNITSNTLGVLEAMATHGVKTLIYSSTCATYGEPKKMPITEETPQFPINPYGKAKKMAEDIILDFSKKSDMAVMILRYFNVIGSDPEGQLGEAPRPELREHGRISGACFDAALGVIPGLKVKGTDYNTADGTCIRDYIDVTDLVDAHVKALDKAKPNKVGIYNVGTGKGRSVKEFVVACKKATGVDIKVDYLSRRPGDYAEVYSDPSKIRRELNWSAQHTDLLESLRIAWNWQRSHRDGYELLPLAMVS